MTVARREALAGLLDGRAEGMVVTNAVNVRYLCGFTGSNGVLLVRSDGTAALATDGRYATQAEGQCPDVDLHIGRTLGADLIRLAAAEGRRTLGVELHHLTVAAYDALRAAADGDVELVDAGRPVEQLRVRKDETELATLATACRITDEVFAAALGQLRAGLTETDLAWVLRTEMHARGSVPAFESIVAFGPDSARPHHQPTDRPLQRGDLVKLDFGALVDGYHADMTRTVVFGPAAPWQRELHDLVREIQAAATASVVPGAVPAELNDLARRRIEDAGHTAAHGLGHGVGLEIHESPFLVDASPADTLVEDVPVTVEPGVYLPGRGGVRIEDTVVVRAGGARSLTTSPRELIEI